MKIYSQLLQLLLKVPTMLTSIFNMHARIQMSPITYNYQLPQRFFGA